MKYILDKYYQSHPFSSLASADTEREEPGYRVKNYYRNVGALYLRGFVCPDTIIRGIFDDERIDTTTSMGTFGRAKRASQIKTYKNIYDDWCSRINCQTNDSLRSIITRCVSKKLPLNRTMGGIYEKVDPMVILQEVEKGQRTLPKRIIICAPYGYDNSLHSVFRSLVAKNAKQGCELLIYRRYVDECDILLLPDYLTVLSECEDRPVAWVELVLKDINFLQERIVHQHRAVNDLELLYLTLGLSSTLSRAVEWSKMGQLIENMQIHVKGLRRVALASMLLYCVMAPAAWVGIDMMHSIMSSGDDKWYSSIHELMRRTQTFDGNYFGSHFCCSHFMGMNVIGGRSRDFEVKYDEEINNRTNPELMNIKLSVDVDGYTSNEAYRQKRDFILEQGYAQLFPQSDRVRTTDLDNFLHKAYDWVVAGSDNTHKFVVNGKRIEGNKVLAFEVINKDKILHDVITRPFRAGLCLKYENMKNRVLLAQQFDSYVSQAYCLHWVDKAWRDFRHIGLPGNIKSAVNYRNLMHRNAKNIATIKLCLDAADYNKQHDLDDLAAIYSKLGEWYMSKNNLGPASMCFKLSAESNNRLIRILGKWYQSTKGLCTGERGTTWVNTYMNLVDFFATLTDNPIDITDDLLNYFGTGDDIYSEFSNAISALDMMDTYAEMQHEMQDIKQLCEPLRSEYTRTLHTPEGSFGMLCRLLPSLIESDEQAGGKVGLSKIKGEFMTVVDLTCKLLGRGAKSHSVQWYYDFMVNLRAQYRDGPDAAASVVFSLNRELVHRSTFNGGLGVPFFNSGVTSGEHMHKCPRLLITEDLAIADSNVAKLTNRRIIETLNTLNIDLASSGELQRRLRAIWAGALWSKQLKKQKHTIPRDEIIDVSSIKVKPIQLKLSKQFSMLCDKMLDDYLEGKTIERTPLDVFQIECAKVGLSADVVGALEAEKYDINEIILRTGGKLQAAYFNCIQDYGLQFRWWLDDEHYNIRPIVGVSGTIITIACAIAKVLHWRYLGRERRVASYNNASDSLVTIRELVTRRVCSNPKVRFLWRHE